MSYRVIFSPEAEDQLVLYNYIANAASPDIAKQYTDGIIAYCEGLHVSTLRGNLREDIHPDLRITSYKKRTVIAFEVDEKLDWFLFLACSMEDKTTWLLYDCA